MYICPKLIARTKNTLTTTLLTYQIFQKKQKLNSIIATCIMLFIFTNVLLDFLFTLSQNSSFYISESLIFSSYWLLFLPLLTLAFKISWKVEKLDLKLFFLSLITILHLFSYPALVWIISKTFYYHTFDYWQTFNFGLSAYFIKSVIVYGFSFLAFIQINKKIQLPQIEKEIEVLTEKQDFIRSILIADNNNKKSLINVNDILYFSANSPYININILEKKYLHTETLKSLEKQLDHKQFVRIHKSHIVNIHKISSIESRQNGDYDIKLSNNKILRLSRNYTKNFKSKLSDFHQLNTK